MDKIELILPDYGSLILRSQIVSRMSKLQKYFSTPRLKNSHFLSFQEGEQQGSYMNSSIQPENVPSIHGEVRDLPSLFHQTPKDCLFKKQTLEFLGKSSTLEAPEKTITKKLIFQDSQIEQEMGTPQKVIRKSQQHNTTAQKKYQLRLNQSERPYHYEIKDCELTLKNLASFTYNTVLEIGPATYREVAESIIQNYGQQEARLDSKNERNIKRRVYDALNVLVAFGRLDKKNRKIFKDRRKLEAEESSQKIKQSYIDQIKSKKMFISERLSLLSQVKATQQNLKTLINRNKKLSSQHQSNKVPFPLMAFPLDQISNLNQNGATLKASQKNKGILNLMGDVDLLGLANFNIQ